MPSPFVDQCNDTPVAIFPVIRTQFEQWLSNQNDTVKRWVSNFNFNAKSGAYCIIPTQNGAIQTVYLGLENEEDFLAFGALPSILPKGIYAIDNAKNVFLAALGFGLGYYEFTKYKSDITSKDSQLLLPKGVNRSHLEAQLNAINLARDMINTPAEDMGPADIESQARAVAKQFHADIHVITGDKLLKENYPSVHAVGRGSVREPRVIDMTWGKKDAPTVTLVGKGVCFDSGGYDIKNASGMLLMKKDMAGSALMLALAYMIMSYNLPVRLRVLIGAVENLVSGNSYKPGDIIKTRSGKTVEINNTDAEGRVVLCDLLTEACTQDPDTLIDFATLTGAARVALGTDVPAMFSPCEELAEGLLSSSKKVNDPIWRLPLITSYLAHLKSNMADVSNCSDSPWGGAITAALYLQLFVKDGIRWAHFDTGAWNDGTMPGRPAGAEAFAIRGVFEYLRERYAE